MAEFRFTNEHKASEVGNIVSVLQRPRLWIPTEIDYPGHSTWLGKVEEQVQNGNKRAMLAYMGREPIGAVVYQRHAQVPAAVEIRNISISPDARGRYMGSFILRNTEIEAARHDFPGTDQIMVDTKITNTQMIAFLESHGYEVQEIADLYGTGAEDAVLIKSLTA